MKKAFVIHPFLFAMFPVLFLYAHNIAITPIRQIAIPLIAVLCLTSLLFLLSVVVFRNWQKAGILVSAFFLLFFSYGHFYMKMKAFSININGFVIGPREVLFLLAGTIFLSVIIFLIRCKNLLHLTKFLNVVSVSLVVISLSNIGIHEFQARKAKRYQWDLENSGADRMNFGRGMSVTNPDIFYIILDGYGRADVLKEVYDLDNSKFLNSLREQGFYIADKSASNYDQTGLSLASTLNLTYLDELADQVGRESDSLKVLQSMIEYSKVFRFVRRNGYKIIAFSTGYYLTEIEGADLFLKYKHVPDLFLSELLRTTPFPDLLEVPLKTSASDLRRAKIISDFNRIGDIQKSSVPLFVFAHLTVPHPSFVFGPDGEAAQTEKSTGLYDGSHLIGKLITRDEYVTGYRNQLLYINQLILKMVNKILSKATRPTIIILQADHGPGSLLDWENPERTYIKERMTILNAYYLPDEERKKLYPHITPVNTFRLIFNRPLLKDKSYFSKWSRPYQFMDVTEHIKTEPFPSHLIEGD